ncbi:hypothetical protein SAMN05421852_11542 [Thermoflavimicrobium dichotomicum]|uniref:Uncharacterized protein n=2 Tax=Thermoflavimicrobium dichotomicum TaxID=46223 RepID=A0A1I3T633_9BACL|nr:hypothetical protein SAMN05421852_11542 [Thermoflavimicrobium dichotomicum]
MATKERLLKIPSASPLLTPLRQLGIMNISTKVHFQHFMKGKPDRSFHFRKERKLVIMGLLYHDVTLLNFDDAYPWQHKLSDFADEWIELKDITEANLFCTHKALTEIGHRLSERSGRGITFIGKGNYHYVTYLLLSEFNRPFSLILFEVVKLESRKISVQNHLK